MIHDNSAILCTVPSSMWAQMESNELIREKKKDSQYYHPSLPTKTQQPTVTNESPSTYSNEAYQKIQDRDTDMRAS